MTENSQAIDPKKGNNSLENLLREQTIKSLQTLEQFLLSDTQLTISSNMAVDWLYS